MKTIRWGIIGVGNVTEVKSGPGFQKADSSTLVAVMRRDGERARDYAERHQVPRWYEDAEQLIRDEEVDAVYIATPPHVHMEYTRLCAEAGKPVYCEKPMALNFGECEKMIQACAAAHVPLWVAYYRRAVPKFVEIKKLLENDAIGTVHTVTTQIHQRAIKATPDQLPWRVRPEKSGGGLFVDLGSHALDLFDDYFGPVEKVSGVATNRGAKYEAEDNVSAHFLFASGVVGVGTWSFTSFEDVDETVLYGTKGKLRFSMFENDSFVLESAAGSQQIDVAVPQHIQQPLIQTIVNELNGRGRCPSSGESGARATWVMDQILKDYYA